MFLKLQPKKTIYITLILLASMINSYTLAQDFKETKYDINGGSKKSNLFNKKKAQREKEYLEICAAFDKVKSLVAKQATAFGTIPIEHKPKALEGKMKEVENRIDSLYFLLKKVDPYTNEGYKKQLKILVQLNDLTYNRVIPIGDIILKTKEIKELKSDYSFRTGSSKLEIGAIDEIKKQILNLEKDIIEWKNYLGNHNEKIFLNNNFKLMVVVDGYADKVGDSKSNLKLSEERAKSVRNEFLKQLEDLKKSYNVSIDIMHYGKGEELPPGIEDNGLENDERRRICRIMSVVGPEKFID